MIFGFSGKMGAGKNFISEEIFIPLFQRKFPNRRILPVAFADQLKVKTIVKYNLDRHEVYNTKPYNVRRLLQQEGTENGRDKYGADIWIRYLSEWIYVLQKSGITDFVITDCRFLNEINWIKQSNGSVIRVNLHDYSNIQSNQSKEATNHVSETELDSYDKWDLILDNKINDSNVKKELEYKIEEFLNNTFNE